MMRHHTIITGTGRAGTTFLMQLFTALGLDTGYSSVEGDINGVGNCGMERGLELVEDMPYIVKSPHFCTKIDKIIESGVMIDHLIVPMRDLSDAVDSRKRVVGIAGDVFVPGGLMGTNDSSKQEGILLDAVYQLFNSAAKHHISLILLHFPKLATDALYLHKKLRPILTGRGGSSNGISLNAFSIIFAKVSKPQLIHFKAGDEGVKS